MKATNGDSLFLYKRDRDSEKLQGTLVVHVDDTITSGSEHFLEVIERISYWFETKRREYLSFMFAGINI